AILRVEHLDMRFGGLVAVHDLSFTARRGDITALIGPNGAGKTTVFNCITGFYKPTEGRIALQYGDPGVWDELGALTDRGERAVVDKAVYWLEKTALTQRADDPAGELPYGDQRRLEIARAMCTDPVLLCLDEPAAGLNPNESAELRRYLHMIRGEHATSILLI